MTYDSMGRVASSFPPFFTSTAPTTAYPSTSGQPVSTYYYDPFSRVSSTVGLDGNISYQAIYHALSKVEIDANDSQGITSASVTTAYDGHGRMTSTTVNTNTTTSSGIVTSYGYLATGEVTTITKSGTSGSTSYGYSRWLQYDTLGRVVMNEEPNTMPGYALDPGKASNTALTLHYAYDIEGDVVGTSDARGCGENTTYDGAGRVVSQDYSPCTAQQPTYSPPTTVGSPPTLTGDGTEAFFVYDSPEAGWSTSMANTNTSYLAGRLVASYSRGEHTQYGYDARGRNIAVGRWLGSPGASAQPDLSIRYANTRYRADSIYDEAGRPIYQSTGGTLSALAGTAINQGNLFPTSVVATTYDARDIPNTVGGSWGTLVSNESWWPNGVLYTRQYADASSSYMAQGLNTLQRVATSQVRRLLPGPWASTSATYTSPTSPNEYTTPLLLLYESYTYDPNGNPTEVTDGRYASEWTAGYKPVNPAGSTNSPTYIYDDMGRLTTAHFNYGTTVDTQLSPYVKGVDEPALPYIEPSTRATSQTYAYDPLDNPIRSDDDQHAILQRSAGTQTYGSATSGPNQVRSGAPISSVGTYQVGYDASGNVTSLTWTNGLETSTLDYTWDEVGHLIGASRGDSITIPRSSLAFSDQFVYDAGGNRIWRSTNVNGGPYYFAEVFRSLRLNGAAWNQGGVTGDFQDDDTTETDYVVSGGKSCGRIFYDASGTMPRADGNFRHVFIDVTDTRGSVVATLDRPSGELVERVTYQPFGGTETDFRPKRWDQFRESYRYTEKEDDYALGIVYYGARYYMPGIQRWASPDPRAIHGLAGNISPYAFVANSPYRYVDPFGLQEGPPSQAGPGFSFDLTNVLSSIGGFFSNLFGGQGGGAGGGPAPGPEAAPSEARHVVTTGDPQKIDPEALQRMFPNGNPFAQPESFGASTRNTINFYYNASSHGWGPRVDIVADAMAALGLSVSMATLFVPEFGVEGEGGATVANLGRSAPGALASNGANAPRLAMQLATQEARSAFTATGELSPGALQGAKEIIPAGQLANPAIPQGFAKYSTQTFQSPSGPFQVHFYMNPSTGATYYGLDYKVIFNGQQGPTYFQPFTGNAP